MADVQNPSYLSIGEVLGLLLEEFPDVTISKIRFLESQGLISPERTASGYRKFYDDDVELLRVILTEQRQNYLPLRVIKDRLETGEIDPTGEHLRPAASSTNGDTPSADEAAVVDDTSTDASAEVPAESIATHPASRATAPSADAAPPQPSAQSAVNDLGAVLVGRDELCSMVGMTEDELTQLESFGIVVPHESGAGPLYGSDAVTVAKPACEFLRLGVDARHLRTWRTSAEREASLYEQLVAPRFRQRNPAARAEALDSLRHLDDLGGRLRAAMTAQALRHHFES